jgi:hypothetical protein
MLYKTFTSPQHPTKAISTKVVLRKELIAEVQAVKQRLEMVALLRWNSTFYIDSM